MTSKSILLIVASMSCALAVGYFIGISQSKAEFVYQSEEVIGKEIALLEKHKSQPPCELFKSVQEPFIIEQKRDAAYLWRVTQQGASLSKLVIDRELTIAEEEIINSCKS